MAAAYWMFAVGVIFAIAAFLVYSGREYQLRFKIRRPPDEYLAPPFGVRIVSPQYGIDFVRGVSTRYGKPLVWLRGLEKPVSGLRPFVNLFPLGVWNTFSQDNATWLHIPEDSKYKALHDAYAMDARRRADDLAMENWSLERKYRGLRTNMKEEMDWWLDRIKDVKRKTTGVMVYPRSSGGFTQTSKPPE